VLLCRPAGRQNARRPDPHRRSIRDRIVRCIASCIRTGVGAGFERRAQRSGPCCGAGARRRVGRREHNACRRHAACGIACRDACDRRFRDDRERVRPRRCAAETGSARVTAAARPLVADRHRHAARADRCAGADGDGHGAGRRCRTRACTAGDRAVRAGAHDGSCRHRRPGAGRARDRPDRGRGRASGSAVARTTDHAGRARADTSNIGSGSTRHSSTGTHDNDNGDIASTGSNQPACRAGDTAGDARRTARRRVERRGRSGRRSGSHGGGKPTPSEVQLTQRVLADLQRQVDLMLEVRLREALAPLLARATDTLVRDARKELTAAMRDIVAKAIAKELGRREER
jgi:hypothetical protein